MRLLLALFILSTTQGIWDRIIPDSENFSLKLPQNLNFVKKVEKSRTSIGTLKLTIYQSSDKDEYDNIFVVSYLDYADSLGLDSQLKDSLLINSIEDLPGETMYSSKQETSDLSFYTFRKKLEDQSLSIKAKVFFIDHRLYMLMVYSHEHKQLNANIDYYLNSFRIEE